MGCVPAPWALGAGGRHDEQRAGRELLDPIEKRLARMVDEPTCQEVGQALSFGVRDRRIEQERLDLRCESEAAPGRRVIQGLHAEPVAHTGQSPASRSQSAKAKSPFRRAKDASPHSS